MTDVVIHRLVVTLHLGHHVLPCVVSVLTAWQVFRCFGWSWGMGGVVDGGGGKEEAVWQCLSHAHHIWDDRCQRWDVFSFCLMYNKAFVAQVA